MGRAVMFLMFIWLMTVIAGNVMQGEMEFSRTSLTADLSSSGTTIYVSSTSGFPNAGVIQIENERIAYSGKTSTSFTGSLVKPMVRGSQNTDAVAHASGRKVSTIPGALMNASASYNIAVLSDSAGSLAFVAMPLALLTLIASFFFLPIQFLGSDLQILTVFWAIFGIGTIVTLAVSLAGGRRV